MTRTPDRRLLVPVAESVTLRETVASVVDRAIEVATDDAPATIHFVVVESGRWLDPGPPAEFADAESLLERVSLWADADLGDEEDRPQVVVETALVGGDEYLFSPDQYASVILAYARDHDIDRILLDPEYNPGSSAPMIWPLDRELGRGGVPVEEVAVERPRRPTLLTRTLTVRKYAAVFAVSFLFYLSLGSLSTFDLVTGVVTGTVVAALLAPVSFGTHPSLRRLVAQTGRLGIYSFYLLWEIAKANVQIAAVVLHPSLPIDPEVVEFRAAVWGDTPVTTLANSITLTPGTLTVDVSERAFTIHTLTGGARSSLLDGGLERAVRFVFFGRAAARIPSPREREARIDADAGTDGPSGESGDSTDEAEAGNGDHP